MVCLQRQAALVSIVYYFVWVSKNLEIKLAFLTHHVILFRWQCRFNDSFPCNALRLPEAWEEVFNVLLALLAASLGLGHELDSTLSGALPVGSSGDVVVLGLRQLVQDCADETLGVLAVGLHILDDHLDVDVLCGAPAIVVGGHADDLVSDLGLAGKLGLGEGGHVDDGAAPRTIHVRLGAGRELGALCR